MIYFIMGQLVVPLQSLLQKEINGTGLKDIVAINERITKINQDIQKAVEKLTRKDLVDL